MWPNAGFVKLGIAPVSCSPAVLHGAEKFRVEKLLSQAGVQPSRALRGEAVSKEVI